jgi:hypothetical protein
MQNRFSLTPELARHPLGVLLRTFDQRRSLCPGDSYCYRRLREIPQQVVGRQTVLKHPQETNENSLTLVTLVVLAISFASPTFAQQKDTADPRVIQQRDLLGVPKALAEFGELHRALDEAYNKNDAAAVAAFFTEDALLVEPDGDV